jgi:hypothetical protein
MDLRRTVFRSVDDVNENGHSTIPVADYRVPNIERLSWLSAL